MAEQDQEALLNGVYIKAFCSGVSEVLGVYKEHILLVEQEFLRDRSLTVLTMQQKFSLYSQMFPALLTLMFEIEDQSKRGGRIDLFAQLKVNKAKQAAEQKQIDSGSQANKGKSAESNDVNMQPAARR